ncbi:MAG: AIPR family protein [Planctomycetota bacterium]|jgi:hypothetical protein
MAVIHIQRIKNALHKLLDDHIDLSDYDGKPIDECEMVFLSRALAAYSLILLANIDAKEAGKAITDGFDDNGIDAILFDENTNTLYLVQSKWIESGNGTTDRSGCKKFLDGFRDLVNLRLNKFNDKMRLHEKPLRSAMLNVNVQIVLVIIHSGTQVISKHVRQDMDDVLTEMNDPVELVTTEILNQARIYEGITSHSQHSSIKIELMLQEWGYVEHPYPAYYGQVDTSTIAEWWADHGRNLLSRNIRNFRGSTEVNDALASTLKTNPEHFWYFNNGITMICSKIAKKLLGGSSRSSGIFECEGVSVVNGAQTVGMIGMVRKLLSQDTGSARVLVRLISLENCPENFDKTVARATNTQNRIERKDFAALDPNQKRLASELLLDEKIYAYKSGDDDPKPEDGCNIVDATVALACAADDVALAVQAKREIGRLWEDIERPPYATIFNDKTNATELWRAVQIMRAVDDRLCELSTSTWPRAEMVAVHGNRLILHRVFQEKRVCDFRQVNADIYEIIKIAVEVTNKVFDGLADYLEKNNRNAYLASLFKNLNKCREVNDYLKMAEPSEFKSRSIAAEVNNKYDASSGQGLLF